MSVVAELLGKIRGKRQERFASVADEYDSAVFALASGESVDVDRLAELMDELDKSDGDLETDVQDKQRRISAAAAIEAARAIERQLPALRARMKALDDELSAYIAEKRKPIGQLFDQIRSLEQQASATVNEINVLRTVGVSGTIKARQQALAERQAELRVMRGEYDERVRWAASRLRQLQTNEQVLVAQIGSQGSFTDDGKERLQSDLQEVRDEIPQRQAYIDQWQPLANQMRKLEQVIASESAAIEAELMKP